MTDLQKVATLVAKARQQRGMVKEAGMNKVAVSLGKQLAVLFGKYKGNLGDMTGHLKGMKSLKGAQKFRQLFNSPESMKLRSAMLNNQGGAGNVAKQFRLDQLLGGANTGKGSRTALKDLMFNKVQGNSLLSGLGSVYNKGYNAASKTKNFLSDFFDTMKMRGQQINGSLLGGNQIDILPTIGQSINRTAKGINRSIRRAAKAKSIADNKAISDLLPV